MLPYIYRRISVPALEGHGHEIVIEPCRAFNHRCLVDGLAMRPGSIANPNRPRCDAPPCHRRCAETGAKAARVGAGSKHNVIPPDRANRSNVNRARAFVCAGFCDGEDCQPGESRQQLQRWLCIKLSTRQRALDWMQRVRRQRELWTFLADVPGHHHSYILRELRRDEGVPGRVSKQSPLVLQQPAGGQQVQGRGPQAARTRALALSLHRPSVAVGRRRSRVPDALRRATLLRGAGTRTGPFENARAHHLSACTTSLAPRRP